MQNLVALFLLITFAVAAPAQAPTPQSAPEKEQKPATMQKRADPVLPYSPSLDLTSMDRSVDPCVNFYQYSCGGWMKNNPIPADQSRWSVYGKLYYDNLGFLRQILEKASEPRPGRDAVEQKIGDYYSSCMDESAVEKAGLTPLQDDFNAIAQLQNVQQLAPLLARLHLSMQGSGMLFGFGSDQDFKDSEQVIAFVSQGGLGLPDRDYYTKEDNKSQEIREKYVQHVQHMFQLLGDAPERAATEAQTVMRIETALAKASLTRVQRRDPYNVYHKMKVEQLAALAPSFDWKGYLAGSGLPSLQELNVTSPDFFKQMEVELKTEPIDHWKTYLRWHLIDSKAPFLSAKFVQADWDFFSHYLRGVKEMQPRWKRCVRYVDDQLGEALGQAYVRVAFSPELKAKTVEMVKQIEDAMEQEIKNLDWMSEATKKQALEKLHGMRNKVGYPDKWRDYSSVKIARGDFIGNVKRATVFESNRQLGKIGKPVDRSEWGMTPPTVNAYYNPQMNDINFPAGVLQPPLYDFRMDDAPNYGNTGSTVGHELTHGFDDEGRQFDAKGNLRDWWTEEDAKQFKERASCVENQYAQYTVVDDIKINSKLTLGEDLADLGGTILAYKAWQDATKDRKLEARDGLTPDQRFFIGFAQWACENERPEQKRANALTDPHSPGEYRINGVVVNMPEFAKAFSCKPGQPMVKDKDKICVVW